mgnify:CR=1 FL=1
MYNSSIATLKGTEEMNLKQINNIRAVAGLKPLSVDTEKQQAAKKRQAANRARRASENRELKSKRNSGKK